MSGESAREKRSFDVASYNILATAYLHRARYPRTPSLVLDRSWRTPALVGQVAALEADIICLQEVEVDAFAAFRTRLSQLGYGSQYARKRGGKPDGCATFYRSAVFELIDATLVAFADGNGAHDSGNIALVAILRCGDDHLGIINPHLSWDAPGATPEEQLGYRQMHQLVSEYRKVQSAARGWVIAGDLNATPESATIALLSGVGLSYAHRQMPEARTCSANGRAKMIDYLFYSSALCAEPLPLPPIDDATILPGAEHPSDHVPVRATFCWKA
jgi:mRNA deadenylase 3'-5' endonuclease subunit Ccr4